MFCSELIAKVPEEQSPDSHPISQNIPANFSLRHTQGQTKRVRESEGEMERESGRNRGIEKERWAEGMHGMVQMTRRIEARKKAKSNPVAKEEMMLLSTNHNSQEDVTDRSKVRVKFGYPVMVGFMSSRC